MEPIAGALRQGSGLRLTGCQLVAIVAIVLAAACGRSTRPIERAASIVNNLVVLEARMNDGRPMSFVLDTGASTSVVDAAAAARAGLKTGATDQATTGGGTVDAAEIAGARVSVGPLVWNPLPLVAIDLSELRAGLGHPVDGILGYDVFARHVVEVDYVARVVRFHPPDAWSPPGDAFEVPLRMVSQIPLVDVRVRGVSGIERTARVEFDTGQTGALTLTQEYLGRERLITDTQPKQAITAGAILAGRVPAFVTRLDSIALGRARISAPIATVAAAEAAGVEGEAVGLLGGEILRRFDLFVDYPRSRALLRPNRDFAGPLEFDMSGMSLAAADGKLSSYRVRSVLAGSPAAEAGVLAGDVVTATNGRPTADLPLSELRRLLRVPDVVHTMTLLRDGAARTVTFRTRRII
jgi:predicted aspartyl protease